MLANILNKKLTISPEKNSWMFTTLLQPNLCRNSQAVGLDLGDVEVRGAAVRELREHPVLRHWPGGGHRPAGGEPVGKCRYM